MRNLKKIIDTMPTGRRVLLGITILAWAFAALLGGCQANEPFDPDSVPNIPPVVKFYVGPAVPGGELNSTSYFNRTFHWSGTDQDGWVTEYYVSIRPQPEVPAPWITTDRTDTTMTFTINEEGEAEATFYIGCRDDRGAYSDTVVQYVPMQNFTPVVNFQSDFDPLLNMQREIDESGVEPDIYWNWGPCNFRFFAMDEDGAETMDEFFRYTLAPGDPAQTWDEGDPGANPQIGWIRRYFPSGEDDIKMFEIELGPMNPGQRTLTISLQDEAQADAWFQYSWEVRLPTGPVLYVEDNSSYTTSDLIQGFLDDRFGESQWDLYSRSRKFPDSPFTLLESFKLFELVIWTGGSMTSGLFYEAADRDGVLEQYVHDHGGKLLVMSRSLVGTSSTLPYSFIQNVMNIHTLGAPLSSISIPMDKLALGLFPHLPDLLSGPLTGGGMGLDPHDDPDLYDPIAEAIYQMEECRLCYARREPYDPIVVVRTPAGSGIIPAQVVSIGVDLEYFDPAQVQDALTAILEQELGVVGR